MLIQADARQIPLVDGCVQCVVTSPPYFGLRDYGTAGQIGLEASPDAYVAALVDVFREVRRVLADDGVLWLNLGDSYSAAPVGSFNGGGFKDSSARSGGRDLSGVAQSGRIDKVKASGLKPKDLLGIPWRVAFALQADGWVLRQEIIWAKANPMPESVRDRCTKSHEQLFMFAKAKWVGPSRGQFDHVSPDDARWLATLIDTEGCIVVKRVRHEGRGDTFAPQVAFGSTSRALVERVVAVIGDRHIAERPGTNVPMFGVQFANNVAADLLRLIYPFLIVKQRQARIAIHVDALTYHRGGQKPERKTRNGAELAELVSLWERNKLCNHFGAPDISDVPEPKFGRWDSQPYFYDAAAIAEPFAESSIARVSQSSFDQQTGGPKDYGPNSNRSARKGLENLRDHLVGHPNYTKPYTGQATKDYASGGAQDPSATKARIVDGILSGRIVGRNKRTVWTIATMPYSGAHFATMPEKLVEPCILAGCPLGGLVLDPFVGSGTVLAVAARLGRRGVGTDLSYQDLARKRTAQRGLMFAEQSA